MMDLRQKAEIIAARPYTMLVALEETTTGEPIYVAYTLELEGCLSQGSTPEEALDNLRAAQIDFIHSLLEDRLPVPEPRSQPTLTTSGSAVLNVTFPENCWENVHPQLQSGEIFRMTTSSITA